mgnify:CR=1 FL=1
MDTDLAELAAAHGVATSYRDGQRRTVNVDPDIVVRVLGLLGVDATTPQARRLELRAARARAAAHRLPGTIAMRSDRSRPLPESGVLVSPTGRRRDVDELPAGLDPGWYRLEIDDRDVTVVVAPASLPNPPRAWGWMVQLYALHSKRSWGIGDLGDLRRFVAWTGAEHGADAVLVNPLHAVTPVPPIQPSPYTPSSRRFANPLALSIPDLDAYRRADPSVRADVDALAPAPGGDRIDYDRVWAAKRTALELLWRADGSPLPRNVSPELRDFATFCALSERYGGRWPRWPRELHHPGSSAVARAREQLSRRIAFHSWVQQQVQDQLTAARNSARTHQVQLIHDLAVGADPEGADAWALQDVLALDVRMGAPPDAFNQHGQNWGLPPFRPDRLDETGYAAYRDVLRALLQHADGLRIDHVAGLWRLWWIPPGEPPERGTYVHYDAEVMLAVLLLETWQTKALVIAEDLGTVEREVTEALTERNILGSSVLWFTRDVDAPNRPLLPPDRWPERAAASISTHDLPTASGFLTGEHVWIRADLGLVNDVGAEQVRAQRERRELVELLRAQNLITDDNVGDDHIVVALHALLARSRSRLALISLYDVIGEIRQPNLPGTVTEYPNWRLPLGLSLDALRDESRIRDVVDQLRLNRP